MENKTEPIVYNIAAHNIGILVNTDTCLPKVSLLKKIKCLFGFHRYQKNFTVLKIVFGFQRHSLLMCEQCFKYKWFYRGGQHGK